MKITYIGDETLHHTFNHLRGHVEGTESDFARIKVRLKKYKLVFKSKF